MARTGRTRRVSFEEKYTKTEVMKNAWEIARELKNKLSYIEGMPKNARDYLKVATKRAWGKQKFKKVVLDPSLFKIVPYIDGIGNGGDPISIFVDSTHQNGSDTFWFANRGKGRGGDDDLDPSVFLSDWENASDYTVDEAMSALSEANWFGKNYTYDSITHNVVLSEKYDDLKEAGYDLATISSDGAELTEDEINLLLKK